jgi:hypothetical protein
MYSTIGVVVVYGAGALTTSIETLSALGERYLGERLDAEVAAADEAGAHCILNVTFPRELDEGADPPPLVPTGDPPPPEHAVTTDVHTTRATKRRKETGTRRTPNIRKISPSVDEPGERVTSQASDPYHAVRTHGDAVRPETVGCQRIFRDRTAGRDAAYLVRS